MLIDIATRPIAELVRQLSAERRTGDLQLRSSRLIKIIFFDHGRLVFAASNLRKDRLGEALVADGRITEADFGRVSTLMRADRGRRFGEALVQAGVMDRYEVGAAVARQVRRIALSLFEMTDGAALFEERVCTIPLEYMVSLSVHRLLYDGIRAMKSAELVLCGLGDLDRRVVLAEAPPFRYDARARPAEELEILDLAKRRVTLRRLAWSSGGLAPARLRATYALLASGLLRDADAGAAQAQPQPILQADTGMFLLSALQSRPDPSLRDAIRREVQQELAQSAELDREAWLRLARTAPRNELVRALEEKMERYHALRDGVEEDDPVRTDIDVILGRASAALRVARQAPETADAEAVLARHAKEAAEALSQAAAPLPVSSDKTDPLVAAPPPRPAGADGPPVGEPTEPSRSAPPPPRQVTGAPVGRPDDSIPPAGASAFEGVAQVEHLLMEGEVRMTVADYANAVKVYEKLVGVAPRVAAFHLRLAVAMACYPRTAKLAEREFYEAARLEPENADVHFQWGMYYKAMRIRSRAIAEMRTAVRLNPRHKQARAELEALSPKDTGLTSLKKLFR